MQFNFIHSVLIAGMLAGMVAVSPLVRAQPSTPNAPDRPSPSPSSGPVTLPGSELRRFHSGIMDQDMMIYVQLPLDYVSDGSRKYPVWYETDANRSFPIIANISTVLGYPPTGFPQVIVVGIGYEIPNMAEWAALRTRDLTPTVSEGTETFWEKLLVQLTGGDTIPVETGGAPRFLSFISDELIPFIESEYQVTPEERTLGGYSYGGLFTLFAMFERPGLFNRYFAGSPSIHYDDRVLLRMEEEFSGSHNDLPVRLFMSAGGLEGTDMIENMTKMEEMLESRHYPGLEVITHIFEDETHSTAMAASIMRGFTTLNKE